MSKLDKGIVSIHAPTRGATNFFISSFVFFLFQSTRPHGARPGAYDLNKLAKGFQSTRPHGARHQRRLQQKRAGSFNPRAHTGRDFFALFGTFVAPPVSIHAPTRGATTTVARKNKEIRVSIHAPTRGATCICKRLPFLFRVSIHAPTRGATRHHSPRGYESLCFNPRAHTGRDTTI